MSISSLGVGSGLDLAGMVQKLVSADTDSYATRLSTRQSKLQLQVSALGQLKSGLAALQANAQKLSDSKNIYGLVADISDKTALSATLGDKAVAGDYQIEITQLASKQNLASDAFTSATAPVGTGTLTISFGKYSGTNNSSFAPNPDKSPVTIHIGEGQNTLVGVRNAINSSGSGISASIITDSSGAHLVITSPDTGENLGMKITVSDNDTNPTDLNGLSKLAYDPQNNITNMQEKTAAKNANFSINGLPLSQSSNQVKDAIEGVTLNLNKEAIGTLISLNITNDKSKVSQNIQGFVKQYNDLISTINAMTSYDPVKKISTIFQGDAELRTLKLKLGQFISTPLPQGQSNISSLVQLGIKSDEKGLLTIDQTKLDDALANNIKDIGKIFAKSAVSSDPNISIANIGSTVPAGQYRVNISQLTPGVSLSGTIGEISASSTDGTTLVGSNNLSGLQLLVNGGSTGYRGVITVTDGLAGQLDKFIDSYLSDTGEITQRNNQYKKQQTQIENDSKTLQDRITTLTARYKKQFTALDLMISKMNDVSNSLSQMLAQKQQ